MQNKYLGKYCLLIGMLGVLVSGIGWTLEGKFDYAAPVILLFFVFLFFYKKYYEEG